MKLTPEQERAVEVFVESQGITLASLRDDVIDHLCCVIESQLGKEASFQELLEQAAADLAPNGLAELEHQTVFLLNSKRILLMKKLLYITGFIGATTLTLGVTFKLLRLAYATELFMVGFLVLLLVFFPLLALDRYKVAISKALSERMKIVLGGLAAIITGLSGLFKFFHLMGADWLLLLGAGLFAFGFLPFYFFTMYKKAVS
ncbi:MAG: hypothetical protein AAGI38_23105 [Bacteroidota bacterium]